MCDERAFDDMESAPRAAGGLTRREFTALSAGAGLFVMVYADEAEPA